MADVESPAEVDMSSVMDSLDSDSEVETPEAETPEAETPEGSPEQGDEQEEEKEQKELEPSEEIDVKGLDRETDPDQYLEVPSRKTILKEYPDFFKKFPDVEKAIYREQAYSEVYPSVREARESVQLLRQYGTVERDLQQGDIRGIFTALKQGNPNSFKRVVGTLLSQLSEVDKDAYFGNVNTVLRTAINKSWLAGKEMGGEDGSQLQIAAQLLNKFLYGTPRLSDYQMEIPDNQMSPRDQEQSARERRFNEQQLGAAVNDVTRRVQDAVRAVAEKNIDPRSNMTPYMRGKAIDDVIKLLDEAIGRDKRFCQYRDELWKAAIASNYGMAETSKVRQAVLRKAQSLLPDIIRRVRSEATSGSRTRKTTSNTRGAGSDIESLTGRRSTPPQSKNQNNGKPTRSLRTVNDVMKALGE